MSIHGLSKWLPLKVDMSLICSDDLKQYGKIGGWWNFGVYSLGRDKVGFLLLRTLSSSTKCKFSFKGTRI